MTTKKKTALLSSFLPCGRDRTRSCPSSRVSAGAAMSAVLGMTATATATVCIDCSSDVSDESIISQLQQLQLDGCSQVHTLELQDFISRSSDTTGLLRHLRQVIQTAKQESLNGSSSRSHNSSSSSFSFGRKKRNASRSTRGGLQTILLTETHVTGSSYRRWHYKRIYMLKNLQAYIDQYSLSANNRNNRNNAKQPHNSKKNNDDDDDPFSLDLDVQATFHIDNVLPNTNTSSTASVSMVSTETLLGWMTLVQGDPDISRLVVHLTLTSPSTSSQDDATWNDSTDAAVRHFLKHWIDMLNDTHRHWGALICRIDNILPTTNTPSTTTTDNKAEQQPNTNIVDSRRRPIQRQTTMIPPVQVQLDELLEVAQLYHIPLLVQVREQQQPQTDNNHHDGQAPNEQQPPVLVSTRSTDAWNRLPSRFRRQQEQALQSHPPAIVTQKQPSPTESSQPPQPHRHLGSSMSLKELEDLTVTTVEGDLEDESIQLNYFH